MAIDGSYSTAIGAQDGDAIVIIITDPAGNAAASRILQVAGTPPALGFNVATPFDNSTVDESHVAVAGTFQGAGEIGITVNGTIAELIGDTFCAGDIGLNTGGNTLEIVATQPDGTTTSKSLSVISTGSSLVSLDADFERGFASHTVTFGISDNTQATITTIEYDFDGDGSVDDTQTDPAVTVQHTYTAPGCYTARVTVTDDQAGTYIASHTIAVTEADLLAGGVLGVYYRMLEKLRNGDIPGAVKAFSATSEQKYEDLFTAMQSNLATIADSLGVVIATRIGGDIASITVKRDKNVHRTCTLST